MSIPAASTACIAAAQVSVLGRCASSGSAASLT
jgi:hypothetical protein